MLWSGRTVLVLGAGVSGLAARDLLSAHGARVLLADERPKHGSVIDERQVDLQSVDFLVLSPGVSPCHPLIGKARRKNLSVMGEVELGLRTLAQMTPRPRVLGITGTNGKTTVTLWVQHALNASGVKAVAAGNVGLALCRVLLYPLPHVLVLELSSYQIDTMASTSLDAACILNVTEDHLDRYGTFENYLASKVRISKCLFPGAPLIVRKDLRARFSRERIWDFDGGELAWDERLESIESLGYRGKKGVDRENLAATFLLCVSAGVLPKRASLESFTLPEHRMESVGDVCGVHYINDSKATNVDAVIKAVERIEGSVVLIAGGRDKGMNFLPWREAFLGKVKGIVLIGEARAAIAKSLEQEVCFAEDLGSAVRKAASWAKKGETVLLSPGCSSFDQFSDYQERGRHFRRAVEELRLL